jgi:hypothetical protein
MADNHDLAPAASTAGSADSSQQASPAAAIDVKQLAERVYKLFCAEVRLEKARGAQQHSFRRD